MYFILVDLSTRKRQYLVPLRAVFAPKPILQWKVSPNFSPGGMGLVLLFFWLIVATEPISIVGSGSNGVIEA